MLRGRMQLKRPECVKSHKSWLWSKASGRPAKQPASFADVQRHRRNIQRELEHDGRRAWDHRESCIRRLNGSLYLSSVNSLRWCVGFPHPSDMRRHAMRTHAIKKRARERTHLMRHECDRALTFALGLRFPTPTTPDDQVCAN